MKELATKAAEERTKKLLEFHVQNDAVYEEQEGAEDVDLDEETDEWLELYYQDEPDAAESPA
jgi:hypothetical protein